MIISFEIVNGVIQMGDVFKEQLVKKKFNSKDKLMRALIIAGALVIVAASMFIPFLQGFLLIIIVAAAFLAYYLLSQQNIEYEYIYTNGELDIDCIFNKSKRKRVFSGNVKDFELMAHVDNKNQAGSFGACAETKDFSSGVVGKDTFAFSTQYKGKLIKVIFEPNEMLRAAIGTVLTPRKFFR